MKRKNWEAAKTFFAQQGKVASENAPTAEDLREIGFTGTEIEKFEMASRKMAADFYQELHKLAMTEGTGGDKAMTGPDSHGVTPLQAEQGSKEGPNPGTAVHTDHAKKDPYSPAQQKFIAKLQDLADIKEMEGPSGEGEGATLSSTNVTNGSETDSRGAKEKMASQTTKRDRILDVLLNA